MTLNNPTNQKGKITVKIDPDLEDIVPNFLQNRQKDITSIQKALEGKNFETIRILGHSMKGAGGGYGFDAVTDMGRSIEQAAKDHDQEEIKKWIEELSLYLERVEVIYEE